MTSQINTENPKGVGFWRKAVHIVAVLAVAAGLLPSWNLPAGAMFGTKSLTILHMHTGESATITFARGGRYDQQALDQLNWLLRDWRTDEPIKMDPRLFDLLYEVYEQSGSRQPIRVVSAYRSPKTNAMLRSRSRKVAEHSQHMLGKAMDFYLTDVSPERIRSIAMKMQDGGVGYYPNANTPFIHLDVGGVRAWPRMSRAQLSSLFPDGKTVHIPADGRPLSGYEEAKAVILARGGKVAGTAYAYADASGAEPKRKSFWATLFGGRDEEEDEEIVAPRRGPVFTIRNAPPQVAGNDGVMRDAPQQTASNDGDSDRPMAFFNRQQQPNTETPTPTPARIAAIAPPAKPEPQPVAKAEPAPKPPARQIATVANTPRGPQMVWQAGAQSDSQAKGITFDPASDQNRGRKPGEGIAGSATYTPLPPSRPGAATAAVARRSGNLDDAPILTASIAPVPPTRPAAPNITAASARTAKGSVKAPAERKTTAQTTPATPSKPERNKAADTKNAAKHPNKATTGSSSFSQSAYTDLSANQFTGPAIKPVAKK